MVVTQQFAHAQGARGWGHMRQECVRLACQSETCPRTLFSPVHQANLGCVAERGDHQLPWLDPNIHRKTLDDHTHTGHTARSALLKAHKHSEESSHRNTAARVCEDVEPGP